MFAKEPTTAASGCNEEVGINRNAYPLVLLVSALAVRFSIMPYWKDLPLSGDEIYYWDCARSIAKGHFLSNFLHPPLWAYVLAIPAAISQDPFAGRLITVILSSFSVVIVYLLGDHLFGRKVGLAAGIVYALYPNVIGFSHYLWPESFLSLLVLLAVLLFFKWDADERKGTLLYFSFLILSVAMLVKEFALIPFGASLATLLTLKFENKSRIILRAVLVFIAPLVLYSLCASAAAKRPVMLADAFVFNSNEADAGKVVWEHSTRENLKVFGSRLLDIKRVPSRYAAQLLNLWTPTSFPIFRLLTSREGYREVPQPKWIAYMAAGAYLLVVILGFAGMCFHGKGGFLCFSVANVVFLSSAGVLFMMCSRFRISFMYIFIFYNAVLLSDIRLAQAKFGLWRGLVFTSLLLSFIAIVLLKRSSFGLWG